MKTNNRLLQKQTRLNLRLPERKSNFFNESNEMYPPLVQEKDVDKKEALFVVDWQLPDSKTK